MPSNAALAISGERQFLRRMVTGLTAAGGSVQSAESLKEAYPHLQDSHVTFYHANTLPDPNIGKLATVLKGGRRLCVLVPRPGIGDMLESLSLEQVTSVASVGAADGATLAGIASRNFYGNIFGLERYLPYGVRAHATLIGDYHEKAIGMGTIAAFARSMNVRRKYLENIERVADELLMNALYDAPLVASQLGLINGESGVQMPQDRLVLQYACDGEMFALGVTDHYGALQKSALIEYVGRCLTSARPLNQQDSGAGAGLGLYLVCNSVSQLIFNVSPGVATEVIALFNLRAPKLRLTHISFVSETSDASRVPVFAAGQRRQAATPSTARPSGTPLSVKLVLAAAMLVLLAAGGLALWNKMTPPTRGSLEVRTDPPGASVSVNGTPRGESPPGTRGLLLHNLRAGQYTIVARKKGFAVHDPVVVAVRPSRRTPVTIKLARLLSHLKVVSSPPGAAVTVDGKERGSTPLKLPNLIAGKKYKLSLKLKGYQDDLRTVTAPGPGMTDVEVVELKLSPDWGQLYVTANVGVKHVALDGKSLGIPLPLKGYRLTVGPHVVRLKKVWPYLNYRHAFKIPKAGHEERIALYFGRLHVRGEHTRVLWDGRYQKSDVLIPVGIYYLKVKHAESGKARRQRVHIRKGKTTVVKF